MFIEFIPQYDGELNYNFGQAKLKANQPYIIHESWIGQLPGGVSLLDDRFKKLSINSNLDNKKILIMRTMGGGDILFLSAICSYIKQTTPSCEICFSCIPEQLELAKYIDGVTSILPFPLTREQFESFDYHFEISGLIEGNKQNINRNVYDILFEHLGCSCNENGECIIDSNFKRPKLIYKQELKPINDNYIIGFHPFANDPIRSLNPSLSKKIIEQLLDQKFNVIIFSSKLEKEAYSKYFPKNISWGLNFTFEETIKNSFKCNYIIGVDSLMVHLSQALNIPTIAIYGPFNPSSRVKYYKNISIIDMNPDCRCNLHSVGKCPKDFQDSPCLNIDPEIIINTIWNNSIEYVGNVSQSVNKYNFDILKIS